MYKLFYKPEDGWAADIIPFYKNDEFILFYLHDWRDIAGHGEGVEWRQIRTEDFIKYTEYGASLPRGKRDEQDLYVFTGSVIESDGRFHIYYTGHNPHFREHGLNEEAIMHAESSDLVTWSKKPQDTIYAPEDLYEKHDWRDPLVYFCEEDKKYYMLITAREKQGGELCRGCTALSVSKDLRDWETKKPVWTPGLYYAHECQDIFNIGNEWKMVFSEFTDKCRIRYVNGKSPLGPYHSPKDPYFDGRAFYAAKTYSDGEKRYIFGWIPTREGDNDGGAWMWGGNLAVHEVYADKNCDLRVREPESIRGHFRNKYPPDLIATSGRLIEENNQQILAPGSSARLMALGDMPSGSCWRLDGRISFDTDVNDFGLLLRYNEETGSAYEYLFSVGENRLSFDYWPRNPWKDINHFTGLDRTVMLDQTNEVSFTLLVDDDVCVLYVNDEIALSSRMCTALSKKWGIFAIGGIIKISGLEVAEFQD